MSEDDEIRCPSGFGLGDILSWGTTGLTVLDQSTNTAIKVPFDTLARNVPFAPRGKHEVSERFARRGGHPGLLAYLGKNPQVRNLFGICAESQSPSASRRQTRRNQSTTGAGQSRSGRHSKFVHDARVIHGDLTCGNIFLDAEFNAKVVDFVEPSIDGSRCWSSSRRVTNTQARSCPPGPICLL
ncbi:hypothetical protein VTI74DRAFT_1615 [Chaetomium olivicolor]